jgi:hypothetical protein
MAGLNPVGVQCEGLGKSLAQGIKVFHDAH